MPVRADPGGLVESPSIDDPYVRHPFKRETDVRPARWAELKVQPTTGLVRHVPVSAKRPTRNSYLVFGVALIIHCIRTNVAEYLSNLVIPVCATGNAFGVPTELKANIAGDGSHVARAKDS